MTHATFYVWDFSSVMVFTYCLELVSQNIWGRDLDAVDHFL